MSEARTDLATKSPVGDAFRQRHFLVDLIEWQISMKTSFSNSEIIDLAAGTDSPSLLTREQGDALRMVVLDRLQVNDAVTLDLSRAQALSPSFADELFAGLDAELGINFAARIRIAGARPAWRRLIASALHYRRRQATSE